MLIAELKKIELRKKEREKKQQDLQKLISAAEQTAEARYSRYPLLSHGATHTFRRHACVCVCVRACVHACKCMLCVSHFTSIHNWYYVQMCLPLLCFSRKPLKKVTSSKLKKTTPQPLRQVYMAHYVKCLHVCSHSPHTHLPISDPTPHLPSRPSSPPTPPLPLVAGADP